MWLFLAMIKIINLWFRWVIVLTFHGITRLLYRMMEADLFFVILRTVILVMNFLMDKSYLGSHDFHLILLYSCGFAELIILFLSSRTNIALIISTTEERVQFLAQFVLICHTDVHYISSISS